MQQGSQSLKRSLAYSRTGAIEDLTVLDIGAGNGSFLITAKMAGLHHLAATDITDSCAPLLKAFNINLHVGDILELELGQYDVITAHHVLEHVTDPNAFLSRIHSLLNDQGIVHLILPNEGSLTSIIKSTLSKYKIKKEAYKHLSPSHHLYFYEKFSIRNLLQKHHFEILYVGTRCKPKQRSLIAAAAHDLLDTLHLNTWLEVVAKKPG